MYTLICGAAPFHFPFPACLVSSGDPRLVSAELEVQNHRFQLQLPFPSLTVSLKQKAFL